MWFSGERTLGAITPPLPAGFASGGTVAAGFTGTVRREQRRLFRDDELGSGHAVSAAATGLDRAAGGSLRLRLRFPDALLPGGEPLFVAGDLYGSDIVFAREGPAGAVEFVFEHYGTPLHVSAPVPLDRRQAHTLEIALPSFAPRAGDAPASGEVVIRLDGRETLRARTATYGFSAESVRMGRSPFDTTCTAEFRGWLLEAAWTARF